MSQTIQNQHSWHTKEGMVSLHFLEGKITLTLQKNQTSKNIPLSNVRGLPNDSDFRKDPEKIFKFLQDTYLTIVPASDGNYSINIQMRLRGGANIIDPNTESNKLWPGGIIPYEIDTAIYPVDQNGRTIILAAIKNWNDANTGFMLVPRTNQTNYLVFGEDPNACYSNVGFQGGRQYIRCDLDGGGFNERSIMHEIGHAIGFYHEHQRFDRDRYVHVLPGGKAADYQKTRANNQFRQYDFGSIMHYYFGDKLQARNTVITPTQANLVGKQTALSQLDVEAARYLASYAKTRQLRINTTSSAVRSSSQKFFKPVCEELAEKAEHALQLNDFESAKQFYLTLIREYKDVIAKTTVAKWLLNYGFCQYQLGNSSEAKSGFELALEYNPFMQKARQNLTVMAQEQSTSCNIM